MRNNYLKKGEIVPKGFTDSVNKANNTFEELKKESLIKGKNLATINNVAKHSGTSRNNFYTKKSEDWKKIVTAIDDFAKEFKTLARGKYKNPQVETYKKSAKECETKYTAMSQQNYELLEKVNYLESVISDKKQEITSLKGRLNDAKMQKDKS